MWLFRRTVKSIFSLSFSTSIISIPPQSKKNDSWVVNALTVKLTTTSCLHETRKFLHVPQTHTDRKKKPHLGVFSRTLPILRARAVVRCDNARVPYVALHQCAYSYGLLLCTGAHAQSMPTHRCLCVTLRVYAPTDLGHRVLSYPQIDARA